MVSYCRNKLFWASWIKSILVLYIFVGTKTAFGDFYLIMLLECVEDEELHMLILLALIACLSYSCLLAELAYAAKDHGQCGLVKFFTSLKVALEMSISTVGAHGLSPRKTQAR